MGPEGLPVCNGSSVQVVAHWLALGWAALNEIIRNEAQDGSRPSKSSHLIIMRKSHRRCNGVGQSASQPAEPSDQVSLMTEHAGKEMPC